MLRGMSQSAVVTGLEQMYGRSPVLLGPARVVCLGASITNGSSSTNAGTLAYPAMLGKLASERRIGRAVLARGFPGEAPSYIITQLADALATYPDLVVIGPDFGTNIVTECAGADGSVVTFYGQYVAQAAQMCRAAGVRILVCTTLPMGSTVTDPVTKAIGICRQRQWLLGVYTKLGVEIVDTYAEMLDQSTGYLNAAYDADGVHPNDAGHAVLGALIAAYVDAPAYNFQSIPMPAGVAGGLAVNPLNIGAAATGGASGWQASSLAGSTVGMTIADTIVNRVDATDLYAGRWHQLNLDGAGTPGTYRRGINSITCVALETLWVTFQAKSSGTGTASVFIWNGSTSAVISSITLVNGDPSITYSSRVQVPSGCTAIRLGLQGTITGGQNLNVLMGCYDLLRPSVYGTSVN